MARYREVIVLFNDEDMAERRGEIAGRIVRCEDCRWWGTKWKMKAPLVEYGDCLHLKDTSVKSDFFCAFGERREDEAD